MNNEPVAIGAAINAAITATLAILLFVGVDPELVGALTLAATAWVAVAAAIVRSRVTPVAPAAVRDRGNVTIGAIALIVVVVLAVLYVIELVKG